MICFYRITPKTCGFCLKWMVIQAHMITSSGFTAILRNTLNLINYSWKWHHHFRLYVKMWMSHKLWYIRNRSMRKLEKSSLLKICTKIVLICPTKIGVPFQNMLVIYCQLGGFHMLMKLQNFMPFQGCVQRGLLRVNRYGIPNSYTKLIKI